MIHRTATILLVVFVLAGVMLAQGPVQPALSGFGPASKFDPNRDPAQDLKAVIAQAKATNRRILLDVGGQWCSWCKYFDHFFEEHADLRQFRDENFVVMKVNFSRDNENTTFLGQYPKIAGYPHLYVLDSDGKLLHSQNTDVLEQGKGYSLEAVSKFLHSWAKKQKS